jgi:hypothetical protein
MRLNRPLAFGKWVPTAMAMGPMLRELYNNSQKGLLGAEQCFYWPRAALVQYWRSFDDLERFARDPNDPDFPAWRRFNQIVGTGASASGTRPTRSKRVTTKRSTTSCPCSAWPKRRKTYRAKADWRPPPANEAGRKRARFAVSFGAARVGCSNPARKEIHGTLIAAHMAADCRRVATASSR